MNLELQKSLWSPLLFLKKRFLACFKTPPTKLNKAQGKQNLQKKACSPSDSVSYVTHPWTYMFIMCQIGMAGNATLQNWTEFSSLLGVDDIKPEHWHTAAPRNTTASSSSSSSSSWQPTMLQLQRLLLHLIATSVPPLGNLISAILKLRSTSFFATIKRSNLEFSHMSMKTGVRALFRVFLPILCAASLSTAAEPFVWADYAAQNNMKPDQRLATSSWTSQRCTKFSAGILLTVLIRPWYASSSYSAPIFNILITCLLPGQLPASKKYEEVNILVQELISSMQMPRWYSMHGKSLPRW